MNLSKQTSSTGFTCEHESTLVYKFVFASNFSDNDFKKFLGILTRFLELKKPFAFYVDASTASVAPISATLSLINWMKIAKPIIKKEMKFIGGSVAIKNKTLSTVLATVFKIQKPICPVKITTDLESCKKFIHEITANYVLNKTIKLVDEKDTDTVTEIN